MAFVPLKMTGRNRSAGDGTGSRYHAVREDNGGWDRALCGAKPGERGNGWSWYLGQAVTCPRCVENLAAKRAA